jgi:hypothetical protein
MHRRRELAIVPLLLLAGCPRPPQIEPRDAALDARDAQADTGPEAGRDVVDAADARDAARDGSPWISDGGCRVLPEPVALPPPDAGCGPGCTLLTSYLPSGSGTVVGERDGQVWIANDSFVFRHTPTTGVFEQMWRTGAPGFPQGFCGGPEYSLLVDLVLTPTEMFATCLGRRGELFWQLDQIHEDGTVCPSFQGPVPRTNNFGTAPFNFVRLEGAFAYLSQNTQGPNDVFLLRDGATEPERLTNCHCVNELAGGGDVLSFIRSEGRDIGTLWTLRPPFTTPSQVWAPGRTLTLLRSDPDAPQRLVMIVSDGDALCQRHGDVYVVDLDTLETEGPTRVTEDAATQGYPWLRGDRVAYVDYAVDPRDPEGCVYRPHDRRALVVDRVSRRERRVLADSVYPMSPVWMSADRLYVGHYEGTGWFPLP